MVENWDFEVAGLARVRETSEQSPEVLRPAFSTWSNSVFGEHSGNLKITSAAFLNWY